MTTDTRTWLTCGPTCALILLLALPLPSRAAEIVVVGSPADAASPVAMAIVASVRASVLEHPWLGLAEIDTALVAGRDPREPLKKATREWRAARAKFDELLMDDAAKLVRSAIDGYRDHLAQTSDLRPLWRALELAGALALARSDTKAATEAIEEALAISPDMAPSSELYNPPMAKRWQQIATRYNAAPRSTLIVEAPKGQPAAVEVDGRYRGLAPLTIKDLHVGSHYVRVSRAGSVPWGQRVTVGKKAVRVGPQLAALAEAAAFAEARAKAWDGDPAVRKEGLRALGKVLHCEYIVLVSTTPRDADGAPALTPVHAELYAVSKDRVLRSANAALGVRPGSAPPLTRPFVDALLPAAPHIAVAGTIPVPGEANTIGSAKREVALAVRAATQAEIREGDQLDEACTGDAACMTKARGDADAVIVARVTASGRDARVELTSYVGLHQAGRIAVERARINDEALLLAVAELISLTYLTIEDRLLAGEIVHTVPLVEPQTPLQVAVQAHERSRQRRTVGLVVAGAGAAVAIAGFVLAAVEAKVLDDPTSSGEAKSSARTIGRAGLIAGGAGAAAVVVGGIVWLLSDDPTDDARGSADSLP